MPPPKNPASQVNGRNGYNGTSKLQTKHPVVKKPPPASFQDMMKLAATNLNKADQPLQPPPPKPKLPRDPPPSVKDLKKAQSASTKIPPSQRDIKKPISSSSKTSGSNGFQHSSSKLSSTSSNSKPASMVRDYRSNTKPAVMSKDNRHTINDRAKPGVDGKTKNPDRFRNDNRQNPVKRPASMPADRFNPLSRDRFVPPSRDRFNPSAHDRYSM